MLIIRLFGMLALIGIGGSLVLWMLTGNSRYRGWAVKSFRAMLVIIVVFLMLLALERIFVPLA
jgi:hypothetical protein